VYLHAQSSNYFSVADGVSPKKTVYLQKKKELEELRSYGVRADTLAGGNLMSNSSFLTSNSPQKEKR
jgi:hypothetical protein